MYHSVLHSHLDGCPIEELVEYRCPECNGNEFDIPDRCQICGDYIPPTEAFCQDCIDEMDSLITQTISTLQKWHPKLTYKEAKEYITYRLEDEE